jgi:hypothetical protein
MVATEKRPAQRGLASARKRLYAGPTRLKRSERGSYLTVAAPEG